MLLLPLAALLALPASAKSLLKDRPASALVDEVVELRPAAGHHFNVEAPQKCDGRKPVDLLPRRLRCQLGRPGKVPILVSVCDDALTFCRQERFTVDVRGTPGEKAAASPMSAAPRGGHAAPAGWIDNDPAAAQGQAGMQGRLLLIDFYGIWCPPCNDLEEHAYPTPEFRAASADFVKVALDADGAGSMAWKSLFKVGGYPTLIVADSNLHEIARVVGYRSGPALAKFLRQAQSDRGEPVERAALLASVPGPEATEARRLRAARWRADRGEFDQVEDLLKGLASGEARKLLLETRRERARVQEDAEAGLSALKDLVLGFPDDAAYSDWASALAGKDAAAARPLAAAVRKSVDAWAGKPELGEAGYDPGDLYYNLASFLDAVGSTEAAKAVWSRVADEYAAQAARSPLPTPRAANFGRAEALMKAGRTDEGKALYRSLVAAYPREFTFNYEYASALEDSDPAAAYPYAAKAVDDGYGDNWLRAVRLKAALELKLGRAADAARTVDEALSQAVPPRSAEVRTYRYVAALRDLRRKIAAAR